MAAYQEPIAARDNDQGPAAKQAELVNLKAWRVLQEHYSEVASLHMRDLFERDPGRGERFKLSCCELLLDFSKNRITERTVGLLVDLAREAGVEEWRARMFGGEKINWTEGRAALHVALRNRSDRPIEVDGKDVMPDVSSVLDKMRDFTEEVRSGRWRGYTGKPIRDVVNIGIGGSYLGPLMAVRALNPYAQTGPAVHFVSNVDAADISDTLERLDPETTLFIVASKSFTTQETMTNAHTARQWLFDSGIAKEGIASHFVAVSTNAQDVAEFGIDTSHMFEFWDWVGGRYSMWSAIGLPIALAIGMDRFEEMLEGAFEMDQHFLEAPLEANMPVILALLGIWYINFFDMRSHAVLPYSDRLAHFMDYLQQLDMESNGKRVRRDGSRTSYATGPIIWGGPCTDSQHSFFQLLHQGTNMVPADFIAAVESPDGYREHHRILLSHFLAQTEALMKGRTMAEARAQLEQQAKAPEEIDALAPHLVMDGNRPTNSVLLAELTPRTLGSLVALYEHKVFVQGVIWGINSFDQWGVELGKRLAGNILSELSATAPPELDHDGSTNALIDRLRKTTAHR